MISGIVKAYDIFGPLKNTSYLELPMTTGFRKLFVTLVLSAAVIGAMSDARAEVALTPAQRDFLDRFVAAVNKKDAKALGELYEPAKTSCQHVDQIHYRQKIIAKFQHMMIPEKRTARLLPFKRPKSTKPGVKDEGLHAFQTEPTHLILLSYNDPRPTPGPSVTLDCNLKPSPTEQEACMERARQQLPGGPKNEVLAIRENGGKWFLALPCPKLEALKESKKPKSQKPPAAKPAPAKPKKP